MVINVCFSHKICGFNRNFGVLFLKFCLCTSVDLMSFSKFLEKLSPNFPCHKIEKKNHDVGCGYYVVDGN
jgi:hypothetical protein